MKQLLNQLPVSKSVCTISTSSIGLLDCHTILPNQLYAYQHFTAGQRALAGLTLAPPLDMGCSGGTTQHLGRNVPERGAERPRLGGRGADRLRGGSTGTPLNSSTLKSL